MDIAVCIKRVPDTESRLKIADNGVGIDPSGVKHVISPYDEFALEIALRAKDKDAGITVTAVAVGDDSVVEQLRSALAMGADRAVHLQGDTGPDGLATAHALAAELRAAGAALTLTGMKAVDDDQQQVGPMLAELLQQPCITAVSELDLTDGSVVAHREVEGAVEVVEAALPAVVSITKGPFEPRYPSLKGIMAAKRKPLEQKPAEMPISRITVQSLEYPPERAPGRIVGEGVDAVPELVRLLRDEAKAL